MNINQRGKRIERELAQFLREQGFPTARRSEQYCGKAGDSDILVDDLPEWHIECKGTKNSVIERSRIEKWYDQVHTDAPDKLKVIFTKCDHGEWVTLMAIADWFRAFPELNEYHLGRKIFVEDSISFKDELERLDKKLSVRERFAMLGIHQPVTHHYIGYACAKEKIVMVLKGLEWCDRVRKIAVGK